MSWSLIRVLLVAIVLQEFQALGRCYAESMLVGAAMTVMTPDPLLPVSGGVGEPSPATEKRGELTARAVVFRRGDTTVGVIGLDLLGFPSVLGDRVRRMVPRLHADNILIGATHTHSAPDCYGFPLPSGDFTGDLKYMDFVCEQAAAALNTAIDRLEIASLKVNTDIAADRIAYNYYGPQLYDRRMSVVQAVRPDGSVICTLVNYAIHPEVLGSDAGILSPDCIGPMYDRIEAELGGIAVFMNGAQGGMITADNRDLNSLRDPLKAVWNDIRTWEECQRIGHLMADEAIRIIGKAPVQHSPQLQCRTSRVAFPVHSPLMWAIVVGSPLKYPHHADDHSITTQINLVTLGTAQILTIPGEALPNIGFYLKRKMTGEHALLFGLTNDAFGYILTEVDYNSFERYAYVTRTSLGEQTGEILIDAALQLLDQ